MTEVDAFLAGFSPYVQTLALRALTIVRGVMGSMPEWVDTRYGLVVFGTARTMAGECVYVKPLKERVNLGFFRGTRLPDPQGLLEGTGKPLRHVKLRELADADSPSLRALLVAAREEHLAGGSPASAPPRSPRSR